MEDTSLKNVCVKCNIEKSISRFPKNRSQCKDCDNEIRRLKYNNDKEYLI